MIRRRIASPLGAAPHPSEAALIPDPPLSPWWSPERHADRRPLLLARNRITAAMRAWFGVEGFVEVEPASLQVSPGAEAHLHAFETEAIAIDGARARLYLHTSPEFACKRLLAAGERRIVAFAKVWRNRERGPLHHPEFTLVEWYRAGEPYEALMDDCARLLALAAEIAGTRALGFRGRTADPFADPERLSVAEAFERHAGIDVFDADLARAAAAAGIRVAADDTWTDVFSRVMVEKVEPNLGIGRPTILCEYPAAQAALARLKPDDPRVAERFELYACGVELANAFAELVDPEEQRRRFQLELAEKARVYGERHPIDEDFLAALALTPPASGAALGFDRLVMLATGAGHIEQVLWTPVPGAP
jgi:lysyl-tRNA synthetase class 2